MIQVSQAIHVFQEDYLSIKFIFILTGESAGQKVMLFDSKIEGRLIPTQEFDAYCIIRTIKQPINKNTA